MAKNNKKMTKFQKLWLIIAAELMIGGIMVILFGIYYMNHTLDKINYDDLDLETLAINEDVSDLVGTDYMQIALFGIDARDINTDAGNRSDTIMIATVNTKTYDIKISSVYRDTYLQISNPGGGKGDGGCTKITHAYAYGGADCAVATLNKNLDLQITDYVTVNFASMAQAIDDLGGITVDMSDIEQYETNIYLPETAEIAGRSYNPVQGTGMITIDGLQAVTYCRIRELSGGDIARAERQREVVAAMLDKAKQSDMKTLNNVLDDVLPQIKTSLSKKEILAIASHLGQANILRSEGFPMTYKLGNYYDETLDQNLSMDVPANLNFNVALLHQSLFGSDISGCLPGGSPTYTVGDDGTMIMTGTTPPSAIYNQVNTMPEAANTSSPAATTEDTSEGTAYTPSTTVQNISNHIEEMTGAYPVDDPSFRGDVRELGY